MNGLRRYFDKIKPNFSKGGKFEMLHSTFDAFETFIFVPNTVTKKGSHIRDAIDMKRTMIMVVVALIPVIFFGMWNIGFQHYLSIGETSTLWMNLGYGALKFVPIMTVSYIVGLGIEFYFAQIRNHEVNEGVVVSGMLIPLVMPPAVPLWMVAVSTAFAILIGKEVFGGTGMNVLNPALTARAFLFFAYPAHISGDSVWIAEKADAFSGATPLALGAAGKINAMPSFSDMFFGFIPGSIGETSTLLILLGGIFLMLIGVASWRIIFSTIIGALFMGYVLNLVGANDFMSLPPYYHLVMGGFAFGTIYMATDPVTAAQTNKGKYIYGGLIGILIVLIRVVNPAYPEGAMLAILLMNVFAPLIDYYVVKGNINRRLKRAKKAVITN